MVPPNNQLFERAKQGLVLAALCALAACGGGGRSESAAERSSAETPRAKALSASASATPLAVLDATRLAEQASFGPTEGLHEEILALGTAEWVRQQLSMPQRSRYTAGGSSLIHTHTGNNFCEDLSIPGDCWREYFTAEPLVWDFYKNAIQEPDQLRQRVALALSQILVTSAVEITGTYGLRNYQNIFLGHAFDSYAVILKKVALSPVMGDYLTNVNNSKTAPNENFARELLQLFSVGPCELENDGRLRSGKCIPVYDNNKVREYAFALTGWTYPASSAQSWDCGSGGKNCRFYDGDMVAWPAGHDSRPRTLLGGVSIAQGATAAASLDAVINSLLAHPNTAPFIGRQLIQHLVTSNPTPAYVSRVANAFNSGTFRDYGTGQRGDLKATVAAILLDSEARNTVQNNTFGRLKEPAQLMAGALRALSSTTDGSEFTWTWGEQFNQHMFRPPSVFNYYPPDYPVAGTTLQGPQFGILNAGTGLARLNYLDWLVMWGGTSSTRPDLSAYLGDAHDAKRLVDRLGRFLLGGRMPAPLRDQVVQAVEADGPTERERRVRTAAYLLLASPQYQVVR